MNVQRLAVIAGSLAAAALCAGLGTWQLQRLDEKNAWIALMQQRMTEPEAPLARVLATPDEASFRAVRLDGRYLRDETFYVVNQLHERVGGVRVLTPIETGSGDDGHRVLVDRGFLGHHEREAFEAAEGAREPHARVEGVLRHLERRVLPPGTLPPRADERHQDWLRIDLAGMQRQLGRELDPWLVVRTRGGSPPLALPGGPRSTVNHLHYAITWFASAAVGAIGGLFYAISSRR